MPRHRLSLALLVPEPARTEVDALRRALGDPDLARMAPHVTLVPPVNVREDALVDSLAHARVTAAEGRPLQLTLGPPETFLPRSPTLYLSVGGDVDAVASLREHLSVGALARLPRLPFVPHVTLIKRGAEPPELERARDVLGAFRAEVLVERVDVLEEVDRCWSSIAELPLAG